MQLHWSSLVVLPNNARGDGGLFNGAARDRDSSSGHDQADQPEDVEKAVAAIVQHVQQKCSQECSTPWVNLNLRGKCLRCLEYPTLTYELKLIRRVSRACVCPDFVFQVSVCQQ